MPLPAYQCILNCFGNVMSYKLSRGDSCDVQFYVSTWLGYSPHLFSQTLILGVAWSLNGRREPQARTWPGGYYSGIKQHPHVWKYWKKGQAIDTWCDQLGYCNGPSRHIIVLGLAMWIRVSASRQEQSGGEFGLKQKKKIIKLAGKSGWTKKSTNQQITCLAQLGVKVYPIY